MSNYITWALIAIIFISIGVYIGWHIKGDNEPEIVRTLVPVEVNIDSLKAIMLRGKADSVYLTRKDRQIADLKEQISELNKPADLPPPEPVLVKSISAETTMTIGVHATLLSDIDTATADAQASVKLKVHFIPEYNLFRVEKLNIKPFTFWIEKEKEIITVKEPTAFSMQILGGWTGPKNPAAGGMVRLGWLSMGMMGIYKHEPLWIVGLRMGREY